MAKIDHAAIRCRNYEGAKRFFEYVFEMNMWREIGEKPERKCWYREGIQLCEQEEIRIGEDNGYDHISIAVEDIPGTMAKAEEYGAKRINDHWFFLQDGARIELKPLSEWKLGDC
ncbi:VOC family protein [Oribacterium sp. oral taxon 102]|uniref:VOC family protein n=1 Tax=Oribacterium sp. oral taxon 102 TaxID=671214 RepID=UPI0015B9CE77|nr:VOC family protein [Oribacterium sp. oral taxon 102]NWO20342.1 VOC family protein [Oribacterium sp. oral taxon 102]